MKARFASLVFALALVGAFLVVPGNVSAQNPDLSNIPIVQEIPGVGTFEGTLDIDRFAVQNQRIVAIGTLSGTLFDAAGGIIGTITDVDVALPVDFGDSSCTILELTLGPLDLDLLGLEVHLDTVHLVIEAQPGPGNLLGNLLCQIASLLDSDATLRSIVQALNRLLDLLG